MRALVAAAGLLLAPTIWAQALLDDYARVAALVSYMTTYVGETFIACAAAKALTEKNAEARFASYRERNAALLERADAWSREAERRLRAGGEGNAARLRSEDASLTAMAAASGHVQGELGQARDVPEFCRARIAAIESGRLDMSGNAELQQLLAK